MRDGDVHKVAVVIASRNGAQTIARAIRSVANNDRFPLYLVVVTDDTPRHVPATGDVARAVAADTGLEHSVVPCRRSADLVDSRLYGIDIARRAGCTHVTFLDDDDTLSPHAIDKAMDCCIAGGGADIVQMRLVYRVTPLAFPVPKPSAYDTSRLLEAVLCDERLFPVQACAKLYTMRILDFVSPLTVDERMLWGEDRLFNLPLFHSNPRVVVCRDAVYNYYWGGYTTSRADESHLAAYARLRDLKTRFAIDHNLVQFIPGIKAEYERLRRYHIKRLIDQGDISVARKIASPDEVARIRRSPSRIVKKILKKIL